MFASGFAIVILKEQQLFALTICIYDVCLLAICVINGKILDKFSDISNSFYNIPWYELSPKDRKVVLIAMNCNKIQFGFKAIGVHNVTMKRFAKIIKVAYTNFIALKNLVEK